MKKKDDKDVLSIDQGQGGCKYCYSGPLKKEIKTCHFCGEYDPYESVENITRALLMRGYLLYAIKAVRLIKNLTIIEAKKYCDSLHVQEEQSFALPIDSLINDLVKSGSCKCYAEAIKLVRNQSGWCLKEAKEYVNFVYPKVNENERLNMIKTKSLKEENYAGI